MKTKHTWEICILTYFLQLFYVISYNSLYHTLQYRNGPAERRPGTWEEHRVWNVKAGSFWPRRDNCLETGRVTKGEEKCQACAGCCAFFQCHSRGFLQSFNMSKHETSRK